MSTKRFPNKYTFQVLQHNESSQTWYRNSKFDVTFQFLAMILRPNVFSFVKNVSRERLLEKAFLIPLAVEQTPSLRRTESHNVVVLPPGF
jgi:hypothetical protein